MHYNISNVAAKSRLVAEDCDTDTVQCILILKERL